MTERDGYPKKKNLLDLRTHFQPISRGSILEVVAVRPKHVPIVPVHPELGSVVDLVVPGGEIGGEGTPVFKHGDCDVCTGEMKFSHG